MEDLEDIVDEEMPTQEELHDLLDYLSDIDYGSSDSDQFDRFWEAMEYLHRGVEEHYRRSVFRKVRENILNQEYGEARKLLEEREDSLTGTSLR